MKKFLNWFKCIIESIGRARAASYLARQGNYEAAKRIIKTERTFKC